MIPNGLSRRGVKEKSRHVLEYKDTPFIGAAQGPLKQVVNNSKISSAVQNIFI